MHKAVTALVLATAGWLLAGCTSTTPKQEAWKDQLHTNLSVLGVRNWVVIAESSYPSYSGPGVTTMVTEQSSPEVFLQVLDSLERGGYVQPRIMVSSELKNIDESYAPGIKRYRSQINKLLPGRLHFELPNRIINGQIEDAAKQFKMLVIKTSTTLPYSNIYIELDSGYWNSESETALRSKLEGGGKPAQTPQNPEQAPARLVPAPKSTITDPPAAPPTDSLPTLPRENNGNSPASPSPAKISEPGLKKPSRNPGNIGIA